ncbi:piggyBac transposable element-derived protein 4-like [Pararge aegeria]|uniref:piggyBac transposable element-derived protein 4-like n=1 Tax=Pararge aegeria TaxID=116150 RepID=UPI0019CFE266|nr:piggyBac transposable element-derived protein 4-like [Pararge aegeria]XP_039755978.1 piggyBac transposable element-derived protein 4-like [Pararge aegeria]XP_039757909.1 piggyBac transposable element-derived protein 4-like [Pararge aegeria]XP_039759158.1 piggyBac transposable element-derived protein 4-like [Pararge aegeria]XP_039760777.1 piggyBac transposable element-derived protein 4-like [Pararge aegeria]
MATPPSPEPGPSNWDLISMELSGMMSPSHINLSDMPCIDAIISDAELYGILAQDVDNFLEDLVNENTEDEEAVCAEDQLEQDVENTTEEAPTTDWFNGNPSNMAEIPFTGTPGLLPPHNMSGKTPIDFFFLFFNSRIIDLILNCTNKCGNELKIAARTAQARFTKWKEISLEEFTVFIGIILFMGTVKVNRMAEYWSRHYLMRLSPHSFMARDRFYLILRALNVQDEMRPESIFKVKSLIDMFNETMSTTYYPSNNVAIDESLILWKGRLSFRQYLKGKVHRYGIKLYMLADMNGLVIKIHLYAGSGDQLVGGKNHVKKVVMLLIEKYLNKGHSLYIDNYYSSVGLAEELLDKNTYVTGTLRAKRAGNPTLINIKLNTGESCIVHNSKKIVVTKWQDKREVLLLSSQHKSIYKGTNSRRIRTIKYKPDVLIQYNKYMRAIDRHDQLLSYYSCKHKTLRWYKKVIIHLIQICLVNSFLLYREISKSNIELYDFRKSVLENLLKPPTVPQRSLVERKIHLPSTFTKSGGRTMRKRCRVCYSKTKKRNLVMYGCSDCPEFPGLCLTPCFREYHKY